MLYIKKMRPPVHVRQELARLKSTAEWRELADDDVKGRRDFLTESRKNCSEHLFLKISTIFVPIVCAD